MAPEGNMADRTLPLSDLVMAGPTGFVGRDAAAADAAPVRIGDAQLPTGVPYDTLGDVLTELWIENPRVQQALAEVRAAGYDVAAARSGYYPYLRVDSRQGSNGASATTASLVQPLWDGGLTGAWRPPGSGCLRATAPPPVRSNW